mgnify:CR=1 FL=1
MQTNFTKEQLQDPKLAEAERILRRCVHCGLCTAVCSTYVVLGDERDSPRGRIYLMKDMFERGAPASPEVQHHVDRCLSCLSCMTTCPSGVNYMHLVDYARVHVEETYQRPWLDRLLRATLARVIPDPRLFHLAIKTSDLAATRHFWTRVIGLREIHRPDFGYPGAWLACPQPGGLAIIHVYAGGPALGADGKAPSGTAAIDHVSLSCSGYRSYISRFKAAGLDWREFAVPGTTLWQLFVYDPSGVTRFSLPRPWDLPGMPSGSGFSF